MGTKLKVEHVERERILDDEKRHGRQERGNVLVPCSTPINFGMKPRRQPPSTVPTQLDRNEPGDGEMLDVTFDWRSREDWWCVCREGKERGGAFCDVSLQIEREKYLFSIQL